jgi:hypothetical protein
MGDLLDTEGGIVRKDLTWRSAFRYANTPSPSSNSLQGKHIIFQTVEDGLDFQPMMAGWIPHDVQSRTANSSFFTKNRRESNTCGMFHLSVLSNTDLVVNRHCKRPQSVIFGDPTPVT